MAKTFREWNVDQAMLFPPAIEDSVPKDHLAYFVRDTVRDSLDLSEIFEAYTEERGYPPYHPTMMTALLLYSYCQGIYSSRRIAKACVERLDFMAVTGLQKPDFRTISEFRKRHLRAIQGLFVQGLRLCQKAGLVRLGHVALDGSKVKANASKHKAMSYGRLKKAEVRLEAEVQGWLTQAGVVDLREDRQWGAECSGLEMPEWVATKEKRLAAIRKAKAELEAEALAAAQAKAAKRRKKPPGEASPPETPSATPKESAQRNFTDSESRIMKGPDGFVQGYNAQIAVDADSQVIVAQGLTQKANDVAQLAPMVTQIKRNTGRQARELSADSGYCSEENLRRLRKHHTRGYVALGRPKRDQALADPKAAARQPLRQAMRRRLRQGGWRSRYRLRKQTVEPVFGQIKQARGFRQFLLRGLEKVSAEWSLICTAHNFLKLAATLR